MIENLNKTFNKKNFPKFFSPPSAWIGHFHFAYFLIKELKPKIFVELGTHGGNSYFAFCQSVMENSTNTLCYAVDHWKGDGHTFEYEGDEIFSKVNNYNQNNYSKFSKLLRMNFDDALNNFDDRSVDLLHIDGFHTYESVKHDFKSWLPKLAPGAVILFHDTQVKQRDFGVYKLWQELTKTYSNNIEFLHSYGLGVLQLNDAKSYLDFFKYDFKDKKNFTTFFLNMHKKLLIQKIIPIYKFKVLNRLKMIFSFFIKK
jgi:hypothetical protein